MSVCDICHSYAWLAGIFTPVCLWHMSHLCVIGRCSHVTPWSCYLFTTRRQHSTMLRQKEQPTGVNRLVLVDFDHSHVLRNVLASLLYPSRCIHWAAVPRLGPSLGVALSQWPCVPETSRAPAADLHKRCNQAPVFSHFISVWQVFVILVTLYCWLICKRWCHKSMTTK